MAGDLPKEPPRISWSEAIARSRGSFDEIERRRGTLAEREAAERSDLPEGQQSNRHIPADLLEWALEKAAEHSTCSCDHLKLAVAEAWNVLWRQGEVEVDEGVVHDAVAAAMPYFLLIGAARVRADVAEEIARDLELSERGQQQTATRRRSEGMDARAEVHDLLAQAYGVAADRAREHAVAPAESVVGAPTPAAEQPDDGQRTAALTDLVTRVNGFVYAGDRLNAVVETVRHLRADPALAVMLIADSPGRALPEDEGTRQEG